MKRNFANLFCVMLAMMTLMIPALAQRQGRYHGRVYTKAEVNDIIKRVETRSDDFKKAVDRNLDRSLLDNTRREDEINRQVSQLEKSLDHLRSEFDRRQEWSETREQVQQVVNQADEINALMARSRFNREVENLWVLLRRDINKLAGIYNVRQLRI